MVVLMTRSCYAEEAAKNDAQDWPQWRGPNRDGAVVNSPKLLDSWPKEGPPLVWKSTEWMPTAWEGGFSQPIVADGKVFIYVNAKWPIDKSTEGYALITDEMLMLCGWQENVPEELAKKVEEAWASEDRPKNSEWEWANGEKAGKTSDIDAYLAKTPELDKYIKDFLAKLSPDEAKTYGDFIRRRLCIPQKSRNDTEVYSWDRLAKASKFKNTRLKTKMEWDNLLNGKCGFHGGATHSGSPFYRNAFYMADTVFCLDARTGKTLWRQDFPVDFDVSFKRSEWGNANGAVARFGVSGTPTFSNDKLYVCGAAALYCLSAKDGKVAWQVKGEPLHANPLVADGVVYDPGRGVAFDAQSGDLLWKNPAWPKNLKFSNNWPSPLLWQSNGRNCVIAGNGEDSQISCLEMKTGKELWSIKKNNAGAALCGDNLIFASPWGSREAGSFCYKLKPEGPEFVWKGMPQDPASSYVTHLGFVYQLGNMIRCYDLKTGETNWKIAAAPYADSLGFLILADGKLFAIAGGKHSYAKDDYPVVMFKATPEKYLEQGLFHPKAAFLNGLVLADGKMFVRTVDSIACYDIEDHAPSAPAPVSMPALTVRNCIENTVILGAEAFLPPEGGWSQPARYSVTGAAVTKAVVDPSCRRIFLTTDKSWKTGDKLSLLYSCYTGPKSEPRRETLSFTVSDAQPASAQFVKADDTTLANWTGVYGSEGGVSADPKVTLAAPRGVVVRTPAEFLSKDGAWSGSENSRWFDFLVDTTDGKMHQVAVRCMAYSARTELQIDVFDANTLKKLDTQNVKDIKGRLREGGKYVVWNVKGSVIIRLTSTIFGEGVFVCVGEVLIDPPQASPKR